MLQVVDHVVLGGPSKWKLIDHNLVAASHGWIDIVTQILLADPSYAAACKLILEQVLDEQIIHERSTDYGNWDAFMLHQGKDQSVANDFGFDQRGFW